MNWRAEYFALYNSWYAHSMWKHATCLWWSISGECRALSRSFEEAEKQTLVRCIDLSRFGNRSTICDWTYHFFTIHDSTCACPEYFSSPSPVTLRDCNHHRPSLISFFTPYKISRDLALAIISELTTSSLYVSDNSISNIPHFLILAKPQQTEVISGSVCSNVWVIDPHAGLTWWSWASDFRIWQLRRFSQRA